MNQLTQPHRRDFKKKYTWKIEDVVEYYGGKKQDHKEDCGMCKKEANKHE